MNSICSDGTCSRRRFLKWAGSSVAVTRLVPMTACIGKGAQARVKERPNFLVIFVDDMGFNDLGCYGAKDPGIKTPNIDRMAEEGVRFADWFSGCSVCAPSRAALLTGRYPQRCGLPVCPSPRVFGEAYDQNIGLQASEITIAKLLKPLGYMTAMYGKSHLGNDPKFYPLQLGFDEYYGSLNNFPIGGTNPVLEGNEVVRKGQWKLHLPREPHMQVRWARGKLGGIHRLDKPLLYNLAEDVSEQNDMADARPDVVKALLDLAEKARSELGDWDRDGSDRKQLLNYTGDANCPPRVVPAGRRCAPEWSCSGRQNRA